MAQALNRLKSVGRGEVKAVGVGLQRRHPLSLILYQIGMLVLGVVLLAVASESTIAPSLRQVLPIIYMVMLVWCALQLSTLGLVISSSTRDLQIRLRVTVDLAFSLAIVWLTGGVVSFFLPILFASVLASSTFLGLQRALLLAGSASIALAAMTIAQVYGWYPLEWAGPITQDVGDRFPFLLSSLIGQGIALHSVAFLGARLMGGIEDVERLNDQIVRGIGEGIIALDQRGRIILINDECLSLLGYDEGVDWQKRLPADVFKRSSDQEFKQLLERREEGSYKAEWRIGREATIPLAIQCRSVKNREGKASTWVFLLHDLTLENRAAQAEARVRKLEALEDLALGLVHEIRNPLASIRGCAQELQKSKLSEEQSVRLTKIAIRESDRLDRIVNEFLEYSSTSPTRFEKFNLQLLAKEVTESLQQRSDAQSLQIICTGADDAVMEGHRELLYRVMLNLGSNAVEACKPGDRIELNLREQSSGDQDSRGWLVVVSDTGCGMEDSTKKRIFNPFFTSKTREGGLGLALVERIVHGHLGSIEVESTPGQGSQFTVWLPATHDSQVDGVEKSKQKLEISK